MLLTHIMYYMVLGPFSVLLFLYKPGLTLMKNFGFTPCKRAFGIQTVLWLFNMINIILYLTSQSSNIFLIEIVYMYILLFLRAAVIACK